MSQPNAPQPSPVEPRSKMDHLRHQLTRLRAAGMLDKGAIAEDALIAAVAVLSDQEARMRVLERMVQHLDAQLVHQLGSRPL